MRAWGLPGVVGMGVRRDLSLGIGHPLQELALLKHVGHQRLAAGGRDAVHQTGHLRMQCEVSWPDAWGRSTQRAAQMRSFLQ